VDFTVLQKRPQLTVVNTSANPIIYKWTQYISDSSSSSNNNNVLI
jgi:hypothetical protein